MRRLLYIILAFVLAACSQEIFPEDALILPDYPNSASEIAPAASMCPADLPPAATRAMVDISTITSMEANVLKIDEDRDGKEFGSWESAYLAESSISSPASDESNGFRTMILNPVQAYSYKVDDGTTDTTFYHTRMISWYPRTATLHKNDEGKASVMRFSDFKAVNQSVYDTKDDKVVLNFKDLDGTKDVMVSNIVEGQHWHSFDGSETYTYPFGHNDSNPTYSNVMTYKHYLAAVKIYAYALDSDQVVSMWGALRSVMVRNQPSQISVALPDPNEMPDATIENHVQNNALYYGPATFSGKVDFPLVKTAMYAADTDDPKDPGIAEDSPHLVQDKRIYLGYALVKPWTEDSPNLELDVHTDAGVLSLSVPMKQTVDVKEGETVVGTKEVTIQAGFIYHIDVNFNTEGAVADIVLQSDDDHYYDLSAGMELADGIHDYQYANCYVVHPKIKRYLDTEETVYDYYDGYAFLATKVGSATAKIYPEFASDRTTKDIDPVRAGLLWETSPGLVTQVELLYGYIRFKVQPPEIKDGEGNWIGNPLYREGNAVIAAYDSQRKVLWSWHIWVTDEPKVVAFGPEEDAITLLDRNLGATASDAPPEVNAYNDEDGFLLATYGLYYQWGRKDPSMGPEVANYLPQSTETAPYYDYYGMTWDYAGVVTKDRPGIRDGVENPMYLVLPTDFSMTTYQYDWMYTHVDNLWGDYLEKTIYDPCPFDYMVPQDEISTLFATQTVTHEPDRGMRINGSLFPFAGYKGVDKGVSSLSGAWKYVGAKGDYMSAKIEQNGHRSRTYISEESSWVEYGADADNDGDGDASRSYSSRINADDMANRRTAASVRCVWMKYGATGSLSASFVGDKSYSFIADASIGYVPEPINFTYKINTKGENVTISMAYIDIDGNKETIHDLTGEVTGQNNYSGTWTTSIPVKVGTGVVRYRLVATASNGVVSRISYTLRLFDIADLKIGGNAYSSETTVTPGQNYDVSFTLKGLESDFTVLVNGAVAKRGTVTNGEMPYTVSGIGIPGHLHIQIIDADGNLACEKSYPVQQSSDIEVTYTVDVANKITDVTKLEAGKPYYFRFQAQHYSNSYVMMYNSDRKLLDWHTCPIDPGTPKLEQSMVEQKVVGAEYIFYYHKDDTKIYDMGYDRQSAGALFSPAANEYLKADFTFGPDSEAVYVTCVNPYSSSSTNTYVHLYSSVTGDQLYYYTYSKTYEWGWYAVAYPSKWEIYPVKVTTN